jgi:hypothetical protein
MLNHHGERSSRSTEYKPIQPPFLVMNLLLDAALGRVALSSNISATCNGLNSSIVKQRKKPPSSPLRIRRLISQTLSRNHFPNSVAVCVHNLRQQHYSFKQDVCYRNNRNSVLHWKRLGTSSKVTSMIPPLTALMIHRNSLSSANPPPSM